jgi:hypothetical protein
MRGRYMGSWLFILEFAPKTHTFAYQCQQLALQVKWVKLDGAHIPCGILQQLDRTGVE